jgi:hypothetical protein
VNSILATIVFGLRVGLGQVIGADEKSIAVMLADSGQNETAGIGHVKFSEAIHTTWFTETESETLILPIAGEQGLTTGTLRIYSIVPIRLIGIN